MADIVYFCENQSTYIMLDRIKYIMTTYNLNASQLAENIGIQRSTLSHILSGRNKPSLDVVQRLLKSFPEIQAAWLLNGDGDSGYKSNNQDNDMSKRLGEPEIDLFSGHETEATAVIDSPRTKKPIKPVENIVNEGKDTEQERSVELNKVVGEEQQAPYYTPGNCKIERVMIFYSNGTVKAYNML